MSPSFVASYLNPIRAATPPVVRMRRRSCTAVSWSAPTAFASRAVASLASRSRSPASYASPSNREYRPTRSADWVTRRSSTSPGSTVVSPRPHRASSTTTWPFAFAPARPGRPVCIRHRFVPLIGYWVHVPPPRVFAPQRPVGGTASSIGMGSGGREELSFGDGPGDRVLPVGAGDRCEAALQPFDDVGEVGVPFRAPAGVLPWLVGEGVPAAVDAGAFVPYGVFEGAVDVEDVAGPVGLAEFVVAVADGDVDDHAASLSSGRPRASAAQRRQLGARPWGWVGQRGAARARAPCPPVGRGREGERGLTVLLPL